MTNDAEVLRINDVHELPPAQGELVSHAVHINARGRGVLVPELTTLTLRSFLGERVLVETRLERDGAEATLVIEIRSVLPP